jgi:hypothetical protein
VLNVQPVTGAALYSAEIRMPGGGPGAAYIGPQEAVRPDRDEWLVRRLNETWRIGGDDFLEELRAGWHA